MGRLASLSNAIGSGDPAGAPADKNGDDDDESKNAAVDEDDCAAAVLLDEPTADDDNDARSGSNGFGRKPVLKHIYSIKSGR